MSGAVPPETRAASYCDRALMYCGAIPADCNMGRSVVYFFAYALSAAGLPAEKGCPPTGRKGRIEGRVEADGAPSDVAPERTLPGSIAGAAGSELRIDCNPDAREGSVGRVEIGDGDGEKSGVRLSAGGAPDDDDEKGKDTTC